MALVKCVLMAGKWTVDDEGRGEQTRLESNCGYCPPPETPPAPSPRKDSPRHTARRHASAEHT